MIIFIIMSFEGEKGNEALLPIQKARLIFQSALQDSIEDLGKDRANEAWRKRMIAEQVAMHLGLIGPDTNREHIEQILAKIMQ